MLASIAFAAVQFLNHNPQLATDAYRQLAAPGVVDERLMQGSIADVARGILTCYHKTARMQGLQDTGLQFTDALQYGAEGSDVLVIRYTGVTGIPYAMMVALMIRRDGDSADLRAQVLRDNAIVPYARGCPLEDWTSVS